MTKHSIELRQQAIDLFECGFGYSFVASCLGLPRQTVRQWLYAYRSGGKEVLLAMGKSHKTYSFETKVQAAKAVVDEGQTLIDVMEKFEINSCHPLMKWCKLYREHGEEALRPKPKGRPKKATTTSQELTREQELEARIRYLETENAYLKKLAAIRAQR